MKVALWALLLPGCLIGIDPRKDGAELGELCDEDFDCESDLVCQYDYPGDSDNDYCRLPCDEDEECDLDEECYIGACEVIR